MNILKRIVAISIISLAGWTFATCTQDIYDLNIILHVPRIYDNNLSLGCRKYQTQKIKGYLVVQYNENKEVELRVCNLHNTKHKINGKYVTYNCIVDEEMVYPRWNVIGDNKKNKFKTASVCFYLVALPSYALADGEDNSLYITLAGRGSCSKWNNATVISRLNGTVSGTLGCGCTAYGHKSPTRVMGPMGPTQLVDDVASVYGKWYAKINKKINPYRTSYIAVR